MESNRSVGGMNSDTESSTGTESYATQRDSNTGSTPNKRRLLVTDGGEELTKACRKCDRTNLRRIQGDTGRGEIPKGPGPYACNDCGWHGEPVERPKQTGGEGRRGLAGQLVRGELVADGGDA